MKFAIGVDCEGVAGGVGSPGASLNSSRNLEFAKRQATREASTAAKGLFDAGAEQVIVWDNHNGSLNLDYDELDERCDIALGVNFPHRWPGVDESFTGILFVGYHAMDNTIDGAMAHSFSSATYQWMKINGREVGELGIDAAVAGKMGVAPIFCASDDKGVAEARDFFGDIETVVTKQAMGWNAAVSKHPKRSIEEIYQGAKRAAGHVDDAKPFTFEDPLTFEIRYKRIERAELASRGYKAGERVDPYTVRFQLDTITDYY
ncbi:MAG: peptidase M55 [Gemmatimonadetes bacterium]|nr:peptidase M55 [Gemmatimonadota bacterium]|tara:strand:+ start:1014 stop:1796 length:783 start_codon:yes stop_codon:yes gene_type:complete